MCTIQTIFDETRTFRQDGLEICGDQCRRYVGSYNSVDDVVVWVNPEDLSIRRLRQSRLSKAGRTRQAYIDDVLGAWNHRLWIQLILHLPGCFVFWDRQWHDLTEFTNIQFDGPVDESVFDIDKQLALASNSSDSAK